MREQNNSTERYFKNNLWVLYPEYAYDENLILTEIIYLSLRKQFPDSADEKFLILNGKSTLRKTKSKLLKKGYIQKDEKLDDEYIKEKTIELSHTGKTCEWCGKQAYTLHAHHYPIPKSEGGTEVINICPNCHYTFHVIKRQNRIKIQDEDE